jgi:hypothetical protein
VISEEEKPTPAEETEEAPKLEAGATEVISEEEKPLPAAEIEEAPKLATEVNLDEGSTDKEVEKDA